MNRKIFFALAAAVLGAALPAGAVDFLPVMCNQCPAVTEMPFQFYIGDQLGNKSELPVKAAGFGWSMCPSGTDCGQYLSHTDYERPITGNQNVKQLSFSTWGYHFEPGYDYVDFGHRRPGFPFPIETVNGRITDFSNSIWWRDIPLTGSLQEDQAFLRFHSDVNVEDAGLAAYKVRLCCQAPAQTPPPGALVPRKRTTAFLLGNNDVIFLQFLAGWDSTGATGLHQTVALWPDDTASTNDYDLYVRCNAKPTPTAFDFRGFSGLPTEFLHLDPNVCPGGTWFVAIHSFRGSGQVNVVAHSHKPDAHISLKVAFDVAATPAQISAWESYLSQSARYYFGETEGGRIVDTFFVFRNRTSCPAFDPGACNGYCNLCIDPRPCSNCTDYTYTLWPQHIQLYANAAGGVAANATLPHEFGHYDLGLPDEYHEDTFMGQRSTPTQCGHTVMALGFIGKEYNFCYDNDHGTDGTYPISAGGDSGWRRNNNSGAIPNITASTPDNYPYNTFNFQGFPLGSIVEVP